jgi:hypothetical protein
LFAPRSFCCDAQIVGVAGPKLRLAARALVLRKLCEKILDPFKTCYKTSKD